MPTILRKLLHQHCTIIAISLHYYFYYYHNSTRVSVCCTLGDNFKPFLYIFIQSQLSSSVIIEPSYILSYYIRLTKKIESFVPLFFSGGKQLMSISHQFKYFKPLYFISILWSIETQGDYRHSKFIINIMLCKFVMSLIM